MLIKNIERMIYDVFEWRFLEIDLTCLNLSVFHYILARGTILLWFWSDVYDSARIRLYICKIGMQSLRILRQVCKSMREYALRDFPIIDQKQLG